MKVYQITFTARLDDVDSGEIVRVSAIVYTTRERAQQESPAWLERVKKSGMFGLFGVKPGSEAVNVIELEVVE